jgi:hypothetical protein
MIGCVSSYPIGHETKNTTNIQAFRNTQQPQLNHATDVSEQPVSCSELSWNTEVHFQKATFEV